MSHSEGSKIDSLMEAILKQAKEEFGNDYRTYEESGGRFNRTEIVRLGQQADALLVGCLNFADITQTGCHEYALKMVMHLIVKDHAKKPRAIYARKKAEALAQWLQEKNWGLPGVDPAEKIIATNLYNNDIDKLGLSIWGIGFEQVIKLSK